MHTVILRRNKNNTARPKNIIFSDITKVNNVRKKNIRITLTQEDNASAQIVDLLMSPLETALLVEDLIAELEKIVSKNG